MTVRHISRGWAYGRAPGRTAVAVTLVALAWLALPCAGQDAAVEVAKKALPGIRCLVLKPDGTPLVDTSVHPYMVCRSSEGGRFGIQDSFRTDAAGRFTMPARWSGQAQILLRVENVGCLVTAPFALDMGAAPAEQTLRLKTGGRVVGRVVDEQSDRPLANTAVSFEVLFDDDLFGWETPGVTSDADGRFIVDFLPEGDLRLLARVADSAGVIVEVKVTDGQTVEKVEIKLPRLATQRCRVLGSDGKPLGGVRVRVNSPRDQRDFKTDADGTFEMRGLPYERTRLVFRVKDVGYAAPEPITYVQGQEAEELTLTLKPGVTVSGMTVEKQSGKPIAGVTVNISYREDSEKPLRMTMEIDGVESDAQGRWRQTGVVPGPWRVWGWQEHLFGLSTELDVVEGKDVSDLRLELVSPVTVSGVVVDGEGGSPVAGTAVTFRGQSTTTDAQGRFAVAVMPNEGGGTLRVQAEGLAENTQTITFPDYRAPAPLRIVLKPGATIGGRVVDFDTGQPVANQEVVVASLTTCDSLRSFIEGGQKIHELHDGHLHDGGRDGVYRTTTDAQGSFVVSSARPDKYAVVTFPKDALPTVSEPFEVAAGGAADVPNLQITRRPEGYLSGQLLTADGTPLAEALMAVLASDGSSIERIDSPVGKGGRYYLPLAKSGTTRFLIAVQGYAMVERIVQVPDRKVAVTEDLQLQAVKSDAVISGRILLSDGKTPAVGVSVQPFVYNRPWAGGSSGSSRSGNEYVVYTSIQSVTDAGGAFRLTGLPPGVYGLNFDPTGSPWGGRERPAGGNAAGHLMAQREKVEVAESADVGGLEITLEQGGAVAGQILDAATGEPIAGVHVFTYPSGSDSLFGGQRRPLWHHGGNTSAQTDEQGKFRIDGLPPGPYRLHVSAPGYDPPSSGFWGAKTLQVKAGQTVERTLRLKAR